MVYDVTLLTLMEEIQVQDLSFTAYFHSPFTFLLCSHLYVIMIRSERIAKVRHVHIVLGYTL